MIIPESKLDHLAFAIKNLESSPLAALYQQLDFDLIGSEELISEKLKVYFLRSRTSGLLIELLEPIDTSSPVFRFIEKRGEALHHICYGVRDLNASILALKDQGIRTLDAYPRLGSRNKQIAFLDPKDTKKILVEICEIR